MPSRSHAWMLEPIEFHRDFERRLLRPDGLSAVRERALFIWDSTDEAFRSYISMLPVSGPDDWFRSDDDTHLVDWYRVLMAPWLTPTVTFDAPELLRRSLPSLGWHATEARRLARGRELLTLAERHSDDRSLSRLVTRFGWGHKGWLDHDDVVNSIDRMRSLDRELFRSDPQLVPVIENAFRVCEAAATKPDHVLLFVAD